MDIRHLSFVLFSLIIRDTFRSGLCIITVDLLFVLVKLTLHLPRAVKKLESLNAMISLLWWMLGFYWIVVGGQALLQDAPHLYW